MIMISGTSASLAALFTFGRKLSSNAGNISNVNTDGYKKKVSTIVENNQGLPDLSVTESDSPGALVEEAGVMRETSNVDLTEEMPQMIVTQRGYEANIKALKTQEELEKAVLDILA
jgi:flagellar basal-body rod protein FlgC